MKKKIKSLEDEVKSAKEKHVEYELQLKALIQKLQLSNSYKDELKVTYDQLALN